MTASPFTRLVARTAAATAMVVGIGALASPALARTDLVSSPATRTPMTCRGVPATDVVDAGDVFMGSDAAEVIVVLGPGADVWAEGGNDTICVYGSHVDPHQWSTVNGGRGDDVILGITGALFAYGDEDDDVILANGTELWAYGEDGSDVINAGAACSATIDGGDWSDLIMGSPGVDTIVGGQGNDGLYGWDGNDDIDGGDGNDLLSGGRGYDSLDGGVDDGWGNVDLDNCHDYANSASHGATITDCAAHLTPLVADGITFG
jgi:Ca2+-binding RTX toxin-like protein